MLQNTILFSKNRIPDIGGMESHQIAYMQHCHILVSIENGFCVSYKESIRYYSNLTILCHYLDKVVKKDSINAFFFNDLNFILVTKELKKRFPEILFILRSGGNDLYRAPIGNDTIDLSLRQEIICSVINDSIDRLIVNSDFSYLRSIKLGIRPIKIKKIRGGVDICNRYYDSNDYLFDKDNFRKYCKIGDRVLLVFSCRMNKFKGILEFINVFASYQKREAFFIVFVGDGDQMPYIKESIIQNGLESQTKFLGKLSYNDSIRVIGFADYLVNPSIEEKRIFGKKSYIHTETMGRSMMEALSQNIPIIASNVGGTKELFYECKNTGYLIDDPFSLKSILDMIRTRHKIEKITCPDYSWENIFKQYNLIIKSPKKCVLVLDLDDTILGDQVDVSKIKRMLDSKRNSLYLIINTARKFDDDLRTLSEYIKADYCIADNGHIIYSTFISSHRTRWNDPDFLYNQVVSKIDGIFPRIQNKFPKCEIKKTQSHIIQLVFRESVQTADLKQLNDLLKNTDLRFIYNSNMVKVYSKYMSKGSALLFVLKDLYYDKIYGAGNGLNDCLFLKYANRLWISEDLRDVHVSNQAVTYFCKNEIGEILLSNIIKEI